MSLTLNPALVRGVLQRVARGQIVSVDGMLRHRSDALLPQALSLRQALHRHDYPTLPPGSIGPPVAGLSVSGMQLLDWSFRQPDTPRSLALLTRDDSSATAEAVAETATRGPRA
ncbi:hypothetical protein LWC34_54480 [Kibdelosporangium philippinense]|uniref:Uncharacterized protein n=1 Tax=Kibdelosporangium philippinense TaxID=211113 RepID=A0ABS8ZVN8_9PSEU|nr:hypothetical protein [Kibdelosporangium philippinense]MCE7011766.1 hypothetical protein [Kibdelosporangium philippinense]